MGVYSQATSAEGCRWRPQTPGVYNRIQTTTWEVWWGLTHWLWWMFARAWTEKWSPQLTDRISSEAVWDLHSVWVCKFFIHYNCLKKHCMYDFFSSFLFWNKQNIYVLDCSSDLKKKKTHIYYLNVKLVWLEESLHLIYVSHAPSEA